MEINGINIEVEYKKIKNMHLAVYPPDGRVHISAPEGFSEPMIKLYAQKKYLWIREQQRKMKDFTIQAPREFVSGESHYYLGQLHRLDVIRDNKTIQKVVRQGDFINIYVRENAPVDTVKNLLFDWYRAELKPLVELYINKWAKILDVVPQTWEVRMLNSRWGSCLHDKKHIIINTELCKKPVGCIEYVVVHELIHLIERTHSGRFYEILECRYPNWKTLRKELNEFPL